MPITLNRVAVVLVTLAYVALVAVTLSKYVSVDVLPSLHTFGFNVGTNNHYCYADLVNWHPVLGCERSQ